MSLPESLRALRVLIIDDDDFTLDVVELLLHQVGVARVQRAMDGAEGVRQLHNAEHPFDVVLCDLRMEGMDGIEVLRHLGDAHRPPALILLSGSDERLLASVSDLGRKQGLNVLAALQKPLTVEALSAALMQLERPWLRDDSHEWSGGSAIGLTRDELKHGLAHEAVAVQVHPKLGLIDGGAIGLECLLRWRHPARGLLTPDEVLPAAEEHGLMHDITVKVFQRAVALLAGLLRDGHDVNVSLNLSITDLSLLDLPERLVAIAREAGVPPQRITLEVAEHPALHEPSVEQAVMTRLALRGFALSVDGFGTGYASLQSLRNLPVQELKVHRAFVTGATQRPVSRAILESSVSLGHQLGLRVVAEGVESEEDLALVRLLGCDAMQGDAIARPMDPESVRGWLDAQRYPASERRAALHP